MEQVRIVTPIRNIAKLPKPIKEFHISRAVREKYNFDSYLFGLKGNVVLADFQAARELAHKINAKRDLIRFPEKGCKAADLYAMGLIDEILHYMVQLYEEQQGKDLFSRAFAYIEKTTGKEEFHKTLLAFTETFPPLAVHRGEETAEHYLTTKQDGKRGSELALEELLMLWLSNENAAFKPYYELFGDEELKKKTAYSEIILRLQEFFLQEPVFEGNNLPLVETLRLPMRAHPYSLEEQLAYIRSNWGPLLGKYLIRMLKGIDFLHEENKIFFPPGGSAPSHVYDFSSQDEETERFSMDRDWMPRAVLLAKSTLVWLDQLSKKYGRKLQRLDEIPGEELDELSRGGFNGLWLIGIWERSSASKRIKQLCGNPEAEASAYSLKSYDIAQSLGGWDALEQLRRECNRRGIRLAADMVPNHTGIDSEWVVKHPDWFIQREDCPFPSYSFNGENLSPHPSLGIRVEDHYYDRSDASVVFKREDYDTGDTRYIYHGNDGTSMPWNDTAQLNFLNPETREAVIQTIIHVAKNFQVIRFDAAMTLAKKHFQRLWFPEPGSGGDIATRSEYGMTREEIDKAMPVEFWREVVDRVAAEVPDTLLLAEAFWMMEGYFVRTLGMHRVYNSAFMNMLKNEENGKYRNTIKNTITFDKEILKRFVNFMNNPDEDTAIAQFGKDDKYFGVCTMMVTMPGLPMFGHGQVEGLTEKYGMEYSKAYWDEQPDQDLIKRHKREIFPLMKKRYLFADVSSFLLYDLIDEHGNVQENVFVYSNSKGNEQALVLFNNAYPQSAGRIKDSAPYVEKYQDGRKEERRSHLGEALGITPKADRYLIFQEQRSGLWYIRKTKEIHEEGLYVFLNGFQYDVYLNFYEVEDDEYHHYKELYEYLSGQGTVHIENSLQEIALRPLYAAMDNLFQEENLNLFSSVLKGTKALSEKDRGSILEQYKVFTNLITHYSEYQDPKDRVEEELTRVLTLSEEWSKREEAFSTDELGAHLFLLFLLLHPLNEMTITKEKHLDLSTTGAAARLSEQFDLIRKLEKTLPAENKIELDEIEWGKILWILLRYDRRLERDLKGGAFTPLFMKELFKDNDISQYLKVHREGTYVWFNKERYEYLKDGLARLAEFHIHGMKSDRPKKEKEKKEKEKKETEKTPRHVVAIWDKSETVSGYRVDRYLESIEKEYGGKTGE